jgi:hypothetical protein
MNCEQEYGASFVHCFLMFIAYNTKAHRPRKFEMPNDGLRRASVATVSAGRAGIKVAAGRNMAAPTPWTA